MIMAAQRKKKTYCCRHARENAAHMRFDMCSKTSKAKHIMGAATAQKSTGQNVNLRINLSEKK